MDTDSVRAGGYYSDAFLKWVKVCLRVFVDHWDLIHSGISIGSGTATQIFPRGQLIRSSFILRLWAIHGYCRFY